MAGTEKILAFIARCEDPTQLKTLIANAKTQSEEAVAMAAFRRLVLVSPSHSPGSIEHEMWQAIFAFEHLLNDERGKTTLLARTRQKINRVGGIETLKDWAAAKQETEGFRRLMERGLLEPTGEANPLQSRLCRRRGEHLIQHIPLDQAVVARRLAHKRTEAFGQAETLGDTSGKPVLRVDARKRKELTVTLLFNAGTSRAEAETALAALLDSCWPAVPA